MRKRILSLLLALVLVLGLVPVTARADSGLHGDTNGNGTVDVYLSLSSDDRFMTGYGTAKVMAMVPVSVPYFDIGAEDTYGLKDFYFSSEFYTQNPYGPGSATEFGSAETAAGKVTPLHLFIYATELYYCEGCEEPGVGYLKKEGLLGTGDYSADFNGCLFISGTPGSSFLNKFWDHGENLMYFRNYEFPLASEAWGATCDQILLKDGDIITLGGFSNTSFYQNPAGIFNYITADKTTVSRGEKVELTMWHSRADLWNPTETIREKVTSEPSVYCCPLNDMPPNFSDWQNPGTVKEDGTFILDTALLPKSDKDVTYMIAIPGMPGEDTDEICSTPGGMLLTVLADEPEAPPVKYGDVNGDSSVDASDVSLVAQYVANLYKDINTAAADVDNSGSIDASDVSLIAQYVAHLLDALPVGSANS